MIASRRIARTRRGAALVTAMLLVALISSLAAAIVWQQWRAVRIEAAERARTQSAWILAGALDWAQLLLREDAREDRRSGNPTSLDEPWAQPLPETRLTTFLAMDKSQTEGLPDAFLSGAITDAQSRYNLTNLVENGKLVEAEQAALTKLVETIGLGADVATRIASGMHAALSPPTGDGTDPAPLLPRSVPQLVWLGIDADTAARLAPYVVLLPVRTPVNLNTATREVIAAVVEDLDLASAERLVRERQSRPLRSLEEVKKLLGTSLKLDPKRHSVVSGYFEVRGRLRLEDTVLEETVLVQRRGALVTALWRERSNLHEPAR